MPSFPAGLAEVARLRQQATAVERDVVLAALEASDWLVGRAARALGWPTATLQGLLMPGRRQQELGRQVEAQRLILGRRRGRPVGS